MTTPSSAMHYRLRDLPQDHPMEKIARRRIIGRHMMLSEVFLEKGCRVPTHTHANEQIACILSGTIRFEIGSDGSPERHELTLTAGEVLHLPPNVPHAAEALDDTLVLDLFSPPSETTGVDQDSHRR